MQVVIVELPEEATRRPRAVGWRPPLLVGPQAQAARFRRAVLARLEQQWDRLALAFFPPGRQL